MDRSLLDVISDSRAADIERELRLAASGFAGCVAHRERATALRHEQLASELGVVRSTATGWRSGWWR